MLFRITPIIEARALQELKMARSVYSTLKEARDPSILRYSQPESPGSCVVLSTFKPGSIGISNP